MAEEGREDMVSSLLYHIPIPHSPIPQVTIVAKQIPGPVLIPYITSDGYSILFIYMEKLSMDVSQISLNNNYCVFLVNLGGI